LIHSRSCLLISFKFILVNEKSFQSELLDGSVCKVHTLWKGNLIVKVNCMNVVVDFQMLDTNGVQVIGSYPEVRSNSTTQTLWFEHSPKNWTITSFVRILWVSQTNKKKKRQYQTLHREWLRDHDHEVKFQRRGYCTQKTTAEEVRSLKYLEPDNIEINEQNISRI
jgi:hypothetical protein